MKLIGSYQEDRVMVIDGRDMIDFVMVDSREVGVVLGITEVWWILDCLFYVVWNEKFIYFMDK